MDHFHGKNQGWEEIHKDNTKEKNRASDEIISDTRQRVSK
jgi:hypothetical protein